MPINDPSYGCTYAPGTTTLKTVPPPPVVTPTPALPQPTSFDWVPGQPDSLNWLPGVSWDQLTFPYWIYQLKTRYWWKQGNLIIPRSPATRPVSPTGPGSVPPLEGGITTSPILQGREEPITKPTTPLGGFIGVDGSGGSGVGNLITAALQPTYGVAPPSPTSTTPEVDSTTAPLALRTKAVLIQTVAPHGSKTVDFFIIRQGIQPELPDPTPPSENEALRSFDVVVLNPIPTPDGQNQIWVAMGQYVYDLLAPYWVSDGLPAGSAPSDNTDLDQNWYGSEQFLEGLT